MVAQGLRATKSAAVTIDRTEFFRNEKDIDKPSGFAIIFIVSIIIE